MRGAIELAVQKGLRVSQITAWFCWLSGAAFVAIGALAVASGKAGLGAFPLVLGAIFVIAGYWYARAAQRSV
jgi:uncharacterized membrane protein HdeD (DUF308 family)